MAIKTELLQASFALLQERKTSFTDCFYTTLFADYPMVKPLFAHTDMNEQPKKLFASLVLVINNLTKPDVLKNALKALSTRHLTYGVLPEHYPMVGSTLVKAMATTLGDRWTVDFAEAWTEAYEAIADIMLKEYAPKIPTPVSDTDRILVHTR